MRLIPKYFVGGVAVTTPILPSVAQAVEQALASSKSSGSESESGSKKSYIELIFDPKAKMLASDSIAMSLLASSVGNLEASPVFLGMSKSQLYAAIYGQYITRARMAEANYENLMDAKDHIIKNGASEEVAFTSEGYMFVHKDGEQDVTLIHPSKFNRKSDVPVTNAELLYLRANDPKFAFNDKASASLLGATSMQEIRNIIDDATKRLGEMVDNGNDYYINPHNPRTEEALQELAKANITVDEISSMEIGTLLKSKIKKATNAEQIKQALKAIEAQLNPQQRALLQLRAKEIGGKTTPESLIAEYLSSMLKMETSSTLDIVSTKSATGNSSSKKGSTNATDNPLESTNLPPVVEWLAGRGDIEMHRISNGSRGSLFMPGNEMTITQGNRPAGVMNLYELGTSSFAGALKLDKATVGGVPIDMAKRQHVLVDGNAIYNMPLPVDLAALTLNIIRPDFEAMDRFNLAWKELKSMGIIGNNPEDAAKINQVLQTYRLPALYVGIRDGQPVINVTNYRRFGVINGYIDGAVLGEGAAFNTALQKVEGKDAESLLKQFKAHYKGYKGNERGFLFWKDPDLYKAAIFIPLRNSYVNAYAGSGHNLDADESSDIIRRENDLVTRSQREQSYTDDPFNVQY